MVNPTTSINTHQWPAPTKANSIHQHPSTANTIQQHRTTPINPQHMQHEPKYKYATDESR